MLLHIAPKVARRAGDGGIDWSLTVASIFVYGIILLILAAIAGGVVYLFLRLRAKHERERLAIQAERQRQRQAQEAPPQGYPPAPGYPPPGYGPMVPSGPMSMFRCPMCGSTAPPLQRDKISTAGWIVFAVLIFMCFPLFWIGLLMKEKYSVCAHCNLRLGGVG